MGILFPGNSVELPVDIDSPRKPRKKRRDSTRENTEQPQCLGPNVSNKF